MRSDSILQYIHEIRVQQTYGSQAKNDFYIFKELLKKKKKEKRSRIHCKAQIFTTWSLIERVG